MKLELDSKKLSRKQIGLAATGAGLITGLLIGWFGGREALRSEVRSAMQDSASKAFPGLTSSQPEKKPSGKDTSDSSITTKKNPLNDTEEHKLVVLTSEELPDTFGSNYGAIIVQCEAGKTDVVIKGVRYLSSDPQTVKLRWDDGPIKRERMLGSTSGTALFSQAPKSFISKASVAKKLVASYTPWNESDEVAVYEFTDQNRRDFKKMQELCK